jgi:hypothetical protein
MTTIIHAFSHPRVLSTEHRALTKLDFTIPKTPFREVLDQLEELPEGRGWTATTLITIEPSIHRFEPGVPTTELFRVRIGGKEAGPRSVNLPQLNGHGLEPGVYVRGEESGRVFEILAKAAAPPGVDLDSLDLIPHGLPVDGIQSLPAIEGIPGWDGWGDEPPTHPEITYVPDPMEQTEDDDGDA